MSACRHLLMSVSFLSITLAAQEGVVPTRPNAGVKPVVTAGVEGASEVVQPGSNQAAAAQTQRASVAVVTDPEPFGWCGSYEDARTEAQGTDTAFVIFFCSEETFATAGEPADTIAAWRERRNDGVNPRATVFESRHVREAFDGAGVRLLVKLREIKANRALRKRYDVEPETLVICASSGEKLAVFPGAATSQTELLKYLAGFKELLKRWIKDRDRNAKQIEKGDLIVGPGK